MSHRVAVTPPDATEADKEESEEEQGPTSSPEQTMIDISKAFYRPGETLLKAVRVTMWRQGY